jgi:hypothetical protein
MSARALLLWAMDDRSHAAVFRDSLFGETRQAVQGQLLDPSSSSDLPSQASSPPSAPDFAATEWVTVAAAAGGPSAAMAPVPDTQPGNAAGLALSPLPGPSPRPVSRPPFGA